MIESSGNAGLEASHEGPIEEGQRDTTETSILADLGLFAGEAETWRVA